MFACGLVLAGGVMTKPNVGWGVVARPTGQPLRGRTPCLKGSGWRRGVSLAAASLPHRECQYGRRVVL